MGNETASSVGNYPVKAASSLSGSYGDWSVKVSFTACALPTEKTDKHIIFIIDRSASMGNYSRLVLVKDAIRKLTGTMDANHTFSVVAFNEGAACVLRNSSPNNVQKLEIELAKISPSGGTNFSEAFRVSSLILKNNTSIIFLTDGDSTVDMDILKRLTDKKTRQKVPIICIGISTENSGKLLLKKIQNDSGVNGEPYYINGCQLGYASQQNQANNNEYTKAITQAYQQLIHHSSKPLVIEVSIKGNKGDYVRYTTELSQVTFDGKTPNTVDYPFKSQSKPESVMVSSKYYLDGQLFFGGAKFNGRGKHVSIPNFKWRDNSLSGWVKSIGAITLGLLVLAGGAAFFLFSPLDLLFTIAICAAAGVLGLVFLGGGGVSTLRKTLFLPTVPAAPDIQEPENLMFATGQTHQ